MNKLSLKKKHKQPNAHEKYKKSFSSENYNRTFQNKLYSSTPIAYVFVVTRPIVFSYFLLFIWWIKKDSEFESFAFCTKM